MKHLRPMNDWSRHESQFEIKGEFLGGADIEGFRYVMPETSDEVRYAIENVSLLAEDRLIDILFKEHRTWKGPIYVIFYQKGLVQPLRVVSVLPDNYYLSVYVEVPEQADLTQAEYFVVVTNVTLNREIVNADDWTELSGARLMKQLKAE